MRRKRRRNWIIAIVALLIVAAGAIGLIYKRTAKPKTTTVRLGLVGTDSQPVWNNVKARLKSRGSILNMWSLMITFSQTRP